MTHTITCETASTPECHCDCGGSLHGKNPKPGVTEEKEGYLDYLRRETETIDERPSESRVEQALKYGSSTGRFSGETQHLIDNMTPAQRKNFVDEARNSIRSDDLNDIVRWVNRNSDIVRAYSPPRTGQSKIESDYQGGRSSGMARLERNRREQLEREAELEAQRETEYQEARRKGEPLRTRWEFERAKRGKK